MNSYVLETVTETVLQAFLVVVSLLQAASLEYLGGNAQREAAFVQAFLSELNPS